MGNLIFNIFNNVLRTLFLRTCIYGPLKIKMGVEWKNRHDGTPCTYTTTNFPIHLQ